MAIPDPSAALLAEWTARQHEIARQVAYTDDIPWAVTSDGLPPPESAPLICCGCDVSFSVSDATAAVVSLTAVSLQSDGSTSLLYSASRAVHISVPYAPTYLAFRECSHIYDVMGDIPAALRERMGVLLLDGNGVLHPRAAGLACQVGVTLGVPTIGVSKTLMCFDGLVEKEVRSRVAEKEKGESVALIGESGRHWGNAILTGNSLTKPIFVSVGHRVSLDTATKLVRALCKFRVPEPVRWADLHSREALRGNVISVPFAP